MKILLNLAILALVAFGAWYLFAKDSEPAPSDTMPADEQVVLEDGSYTVATSSTIGWSGKRPLIPGYVDRGTVEVESGNLEVEGGVITGGSFTIDMATITAVSTGRGDGQDRLSTHLKSDDFFDVENFPTATFEITSTVAAGGISGNLTVKGVTLPITFPATISQDGDTLRAEATIELDRTDWSIRYGSGQFFDDLGDNLIDDMFTITLDLTATKTQ